MTVVQLQGQSQVQCSIKYVIVFIVTTDTGTCMVDAPLKQIKRHLTVDMVKYFFEETFI